LHEEKLSSGLERLKATLTDNRVGVVIGSKFGIFVVGRHGVFVTMLWYELQLNSEFDTN
jgi:hypothetical protein